MKSISIPFSFTSDTGAVSTVSDVDAVMKQNIIDILTTFPGERVMTPNYGAGIRSLLFEQPDPLVFAEYRMDAINDLNSSLPFGKVTDVQIGIPYDSLSSFETDSTISVSVKYVIPPYDTSVVTFNLNSTSTTFGEA
jgi:hypothetical protein